MKFTKIFYGNQYVSKFNCDGKRYTKWQIFKIKTKRLIKGLLFWAVIITLIFTATRVLFPRVMEIEKEVIKQVDPEYPVLERIAKCESNGNHYSPNGQVQANGNDNGSVDIGLFQINLTIHGKKATEMGLDLTKEEDNRKFAVYLYKTLGTEPWVWSKKCWNK